MNFQHGPASVNILCISRDRQMGRGGDSTPENRMMAVYI